LRLQNLPAKARVAAIKNKEPIQRQTNWRAARKKPLQALFVGSVPNKKPLQPLFVGSAPNKRPLQPLFAGIVEGRHQNHGSTQASGGALGVLGAWFVEFGEETADCRASPPKDRRAGIN